MPSPVFRFPWRCLLAGFLLMLSSCQPAASGKPLAVATIFSYFDILRTLGGEEIQSVLLLPPGTSPHEYDPPAQAKIQVQKAALIVNNGLGLDEWIGKLAADNTRAIKLTVAQRVEALPETAAITLSDEKGHEHAHDGASAKNPHIWLDPRLQKAAALMILQALIQIDPPHEALFRQRSASYCQALEELDRDFLAAAKTWPRREFIGFHSAYDYLAKRYGLKQVASVEEMPEQGPTPAQVQKIITLIKSQKINVIFSETAFASKDAELIVRQTGVKLGVLQPLETYDRLEDTYISLMRQNLAALQSALGS